jgi:hypothetical protein
LLEFHSQLFDYLLALANVRFCLVSGQSLSCAANGKSIVVQETANLTNDQNILALIIAAVTAPFYRLQLRKLLFPVAQYMWLHGTQVTDFTYGEIALSWDWR